MLSALIIAAMVLLIMCFIGFSLYLQSVIEKESVLEAELEEAVENLAVIQRSRERQIKRSW
ncbi:hypothetical protein YOLOSWAG_256 [Erwinia phage vB_EamM_Yoloswag]|uniref:Uncharacterized protein n=1 Tax=Erwinia phage vB_EamM_Yoloswag TaxID=1958956 RepID=A0A1S6L3H7_9CAUD|nr:hypothetical protein HOR66_gp256 [Erwinia phage vB_EamM_Yoloswag]AQT28730.1 hypothetical protein YOLOSWAG_256 [Erwinia phage vB_EamM_Yoloswag]